MFSQMLILVGALSALSPTRPETVVAKNAPQLEQEIGDISGYYTCKGLEVGGKQYNGVVVISRKSDIYLVQWMIGSGSTFTGVGIRQGNTLSASWAIPGERGVVRGINVYRIETSSSGPRLVGRWASLPGPGALQNETLTFLKEMQEEE
jgi:hypothetical protein